MTTNVSNMGTLSQKAVLISLSIHQKGLSKVDKEVTESVMKHYNAKSDAGRVSKNLFDPKEPWILAIKQTANKARTIFYGKTLPWKDDGYRMCPSAIYSDLATELRAVHHEWDTNVANAVKEYRKRLANGTFERERMKALGKMYKASEYPPPEEFEAEYKFEVETIPLPDERDFRVHLQADELARVKQEVATENQVREQEAMKDLWNRTYSTVKHMADKLGTTRQVKVKGKNGKRGHTEERPEIFRDSLVDNVRELCRLLPKLNIAGDQELDKLARDVEGKLTKIDPGELRENDKKRKAVAKDAKEIVDKMTAYMGDLAEVKTDEEE